MHLAELVASRSVPGAGVFAFLTRRCPLRCGHCSTSSTPDAEQRGGQMYLRFVRSFAADCHPDYLLLTGGEPLLRPRLVAALAGAARAAGTRSYLLTGMYCARTGRIPGPCWHALRSVDHVAVSVDAWHEAQVPRRRVFDALHRLLRTGSDVSLQITGQGDDDPYLGRLTEQVRAEFEDRVPMLVGTVRPYGRARTLPGSRGPQISAGRPSSRGRAPRGDEPPRPLPCTMAAWPVIGPDGTVTACGNQAVVDHAPLPGHLRLGHLLTDDWRSLSARCRTAPLLWALRTVGPEVVASQGPGHRAADGYCHTCWQLDKDPAAAALAARLSLRPGATTVAAQVMALQQEGGAVAFVRRYGSSRYAGLVLLGASGPAACAALAGTR